MCFYNGLSIVLCIPKCAKRLIALLIMSEYKAGLSRVRSHQLFNILNIPPAHRGYASAGLGTDSGS